LWKIHLANRLRLGEHALWLGSGLDALWCKEAPAKNDDENSKNEMEFSGLGHLALRALPSMTLVILRAAFH